MEMQRLHPLATLQEAANLHQRYQAGEGFRVYLNACSNPTQKHYSRPRNVPGPLALRSTSSYLSGRKNENKEATMKLNANQLLEAIPALILRILSYGLLVLLSGAILQKFGVRIPYVPTIDVTQLAYLCGAWWLCNR